MYHTDHIAIYYWKRFRECPYVFGRARFADLYYLNRSISAEQD